MQSSLQVPSNPPYRLATLISEQGMQVSPQSEGWSQGSNELAGICFDQPPASVELQGGYALAAQHKLLAPPFSLSKGRSVLVYELVRPSPSSTSADLAALAKKYVSLGADALCVRVDSEDTPEGLKDLFVVSQAVKVPVIARDYIIHPLQIVEVKESGAAGALGVIGQVNGRGTAILSSFAAALGLDAPVEVGDPIRDPSFCLFLQPRFPCSAHSSCPHPRAHALTGRQPA
jgi:hypothetical protein